MVEEDLIKFNEACRLKEMIGHFHVHIIPKVGDEFRSKGEVFGLLKNFDNDLIRFYKTKLINKQVAQHSLKNSVYESERLKELVQKFLQEIHDDACPVQL